MFFQELPPEVQAQIFSHLITPEGPSPIHAVLRTCKQLYQVALPLSVHTFRNVRKGGGQCPNSRNAKFLRYILVSKPELAKHVKTIIIGMFSAFIGVHGHKTSTPAESSTYRRYITMVLSPQTLRDHELECSRWITDLEQGVTDAQVALILLACQNVKSLYFEQPRNGRNFSFLLRLTKFLSKSKNCDRVPLSKLQEVYNEAAAKDIVPDLSGPDIMALMSLPSLRSIEVTLADNSSETTTPIAILPNKSSLVEEIILSKCQFSGPQLSRLVSVCKHLRSFELTHDTRGPDTLYLQAGDLLAALLPHAETLENLYVLLDEYRIKRGPSEKLHMGTELRRMVALKRLHIGMLDLASMVDAESDGAVGAEAISGIEAAPRIVDCLPENLEHLVIHGCERSILDQAQELLDVIKNNERFRKLECVHFLFKSESVHSSEVKLQPGIPKPRLLVVFQDRRSRGIDSAPGHTPVRPHRRQIAKTMCSRIYCPNRRERWLNYRGTLSKPLWQPPPSQEGFAFDNHFVGMSGEFFAVDCGDWRRR